MLVIETTREAFYELRELRNYELDSLNSTSEFWERLADYTEVDPNWLFDKAVLFPGLIRATQAARPDIQRPTVIDIWFFIHVGEDERHRAYDSSSFAAVSSTLPGESFLLARVL